MFGVNTGRLEFGLTVSSTQSRETQVENYLSWKKKTYADPKHAMTQISQRMWHVHGPSSLSINLMTHHTVIITCLNSTSELTSAVICDGNNENTEMVLS